MRKPVLVAQLSDPHVGATWAEADPHVGLAATVERIRRLPDRPDAVLITGDLADNAGAEEYEFVRREVARLEAATFAVAGNHDDRDALRRCFQLPGDEGTPLQYTAEVGPLRLVVVDSTRPGDDAGELDGERLAWLEAELAAEPDRPTLVAVHHPPLRIGSAAWDALCLPVADRAALGDVLARHPQVVRVVAGHVHQTITGDVGGRAVLAAPSTYVQAKLDLEANVIAFSDEPPGFAIHALVEGAVVSYVRTAAA